MVSHMGPDVSSTQVTAPVLDDIVLDYLKAADAGRAPSAEELLARYPDLADALRAFLEDERLLDPLCQPFKMPVAVEPTLPWMWPGNPGPTTFGQYEGLEQLGRGGMGVVYKVQQQWPKGLVALKVMRAGHGTLPADLQRFRREAEDMANLDHPHIVPVHEV